MSSRYIQQCQHMPKIMMMMMIVYPPFAGRLNVPNDGAVLADLTIVFATITPHACTLGAEHVTHPLCSLYVSLQAALMRQTTPRWPPWLMPPTRITTRRRLRPPRPARIPAMTQMARSRATRRSWRTTSSRATKPTCTGTRRSKQSGQSKKRREERASGSGSHRRTMGALAAVARLMVRCTRTSLLANVLPYCAMHWDCPWHDHDAQVFARIPGLDVHSAFAHLPRCHAAGAAADMHNNLSALPVAAATESPQGSEDVTAGGGLLVGLDARQAGVRAGGAALAQQWFAQDAFQVRAYRALGMWIGMWSLPERRLRSSSLRERS